MAIGFRAANGAGLGAAATSISTSQPAGLTVGDVMVMGVSVRGGTNTTASSGTLTTVATTGVTDSAVPHPDGTRVYVCTGGVSSIDIIATSTNTKTTVTVAGSAHGVTISPNGKYVLVPNATNIAVISTSSDTVTTTIARSYTVIDANAVWTSDSAYCFIQSWDNNSVTVIRSSDWSVFAEPYVYTPSGDIVVTQDNAYVYCASRDKDPTNRTLAKIRVSDGVVVANIVLSTGNLVTNNPMVVTASYVYIGIWGTTTVRQVTISDDSTSDITVGGSNVTAMALTLDSAYIYVLRSSGVDVIRTSNSTVPTTGLLGNTMAAIFCTASYAYIAASTTATYVLRTGDNSTAAIITGGTVAGSKFAVLSNGTAAYGVTGGGSSTVYVTDLVNWWTLLSSTDSTTTLKHAVWWRVATTSELSTFVVTFNGSQLASVVVSAFSGAETRRPVPAQIGAQANASSVNVVAAADGSWTTRNGMDVGVFGTAYGSSFTPPGSYTEPANGDKASTGTTLATTTEIAYRALSAVTTVASITAVAANAAVNVGVHVFIKEYLATTYFYLHDAATTDTGTLPTGTTSQQTPFATAPPFSTVRSANFSMGTGSTDRSDPWGGGYIPILRFASPPLAAQALAGKFSLNFAGCGTFTYSGVFYSVISLWRPSTGALVGRLWDGAFTGTQDASTASQSDVWMSGALQTLTSQTAQAGDILVLEVWDNVAGGSGTYVGYDGYAELSATNPASYFYIEDGITLFNPEALTPAITEVLYGLV